jgi:transcriptional regulator with XRE-family HTH domain
MRIDKDRAMVAAVRKKEPVVAPGIRVGLKMKHTRLLKGLTLKQLAELAGCSESVLSRIENGNANPSIKMHRVASALGMPVSGLFQENLESSDVVMRRGERPTVGTDQIRLGKGHKLEALIPSGRGNLLSGYINDIEPGGGSEGVIQHEGEEFGYVLDGEIELTVDNRNYQLREGDSFYFRSERPHSYSNNRKKIARVLWVNTPPSF